MNIYPPVIVKLLVDLWYEKKLEMMASSFVVNLKNVKYDLKSYKSICSIEKYYCWYFWAYTCISFYFQIKLNLDFFCRNVYSMDLGIDEQDNNNHFFFKEKSTTEKDRSSQKWRAFCIFTASKRSSDRLGKIDWVEQTIIFTNDDDSTCEIDRWLVY